MTLDEAIKTYGISNAEYERTHGNLQGYLDFKQLAEWLKDYKRLLEQQNALFKSGLIKDCESCRAEQEFCEDAVSREDVISEIHNTIFTFFDICEDDEETPMNDKDKLLLKVNKAICNNVKSMKPVTPMLLSSCEDAVSRFEAYEALNSINGTSELDMAFEAIENLPSVKPVACIAKVTFDKDYMQELVDKRVEELVTCKKGKWIKTGGSFRCSECMSMPEFKDIRRLKFCPNCGAEMEGVEE